MAWDTIEDAFKDLDEKEYAIVARILGAYRSSLMKDGGFTRKEAMRLVESYSKFIYDMSIEEFLARKVAEEDNDLKNEFDRDDDDDDFDSDAQEEL